MRNIFSHAQTSWKKPSVEGVPATYEDVIAAAEAIRAAGIMEYPVALNTKAGWNIAEEFVNMYMGTGADFFKPGTAEASVNNEHGVATLNMLKSLVAYSNPDYLTYDSNATQAEWEAGNLALATNVGLSRRRGFWTAKAQPRWSHPAQFCPPHLPGATAHVQRPHYGGSGISISTNVSDEDAEATFVAMVKGISSDVVKANNDAAVWLVEGYEPSAASAGISATASGGAAPYPHAARSWPHCTRHLVRKSLTSCRALKAPSQALADVEAAYTARLQKSKVS